MKQIDASERLDAFSASEGVKMTFERRDKLTVEQIRTLYPFDVARLAEQAGVRHA